MRTSKSILAKALVTILILVMPVNADEAFDDLTANLGEFSKAQQTFLINAQNGSAAEKREVGKLFLWGPQLVVDHKRALDWLLAAASEGDPEANYIIGDFYEFMSDRPDPAQAFQWYKKAAQRGYPAAQWRMGVAYQYGEQVELDLDEAMHWYELAAAQGDAYAFESIGELYFFGDGVVADYQKAMFWLRKAAESGISSAFTKIGSMYQHGNGVAQDYDQARNWYERSFESGNTEAAYLLGVLYYTEANEAEDYRLALNWFEEAAKADDPDAHLYIGIMNYFGNGVDVDYAAAQKSYEHAAGLGSAEAARRLGTMFFWGDGVSVNYKSAFNWFRKAADMGDVNAHLRIGLLYYFGHGVEIDYQLASKWFEQASNLGSAEATRRLGIMSYFGEGSDVNYQSAMYYFEKAAQLGDANAHLRIGLMHYYGQGVDVNFALAKKWFEQAASLGSAEANTSIGIMHLFGDGVDVDFDIAMEKFKIAAQLGEPDAHLRIGLMYYFGTGVEIDPVAAKEWFELASDLGSVEATRRLGIMSYFGDGSDVDYQAAMSYFEHAAQSGDAEAHLYIGLMHYFGNGVVIDYNLAIKWLKRSATLGNSEAARRVATLYYYGDGVAIDLTKALHWFEQAAEMGDPQAHYDTGYMYLNGEGVTPNTSIAEFWFQKGSKLGDESSIIARANLLLEQNPGPTDFANAVSILREGVELGSLAASSNLASLYSRIGDQSELEKLIYSDYQEWDFEEVHANEDHYWMLRSVVDFYYEAEIYDLALGWQQVIVGLAQQYFGEDHWEHVHALNYLAAVNTKLGQVTKAESLVIKAVELSKNNPKIDDILLGVLSHTLGEIKYRQGANPNADFAQAEYHYTLANEFWALGELYKSKAENQIYLNDCKTAMDNIARANQNLDKADDRRHVIRLELKILETSALLCLNKPFEANGRILKLSAGITQYNNWSLSTKYSENSAKRRLSGEVFRLAVNEKLSDIVPIEILFELFQEVNFSVQSQEYILNAMAGANLERNNQNLSKIKRAFRDFAVSTTDIGNRSKSEVLHAYTLRSNAYEVIATEGHMTQNIDKVRAELVNPQPLSLSDTQDLLGLNEGLFTFVSDEETEATYAFMVTKDDARAYQVDLSEAQIAEIVSTLRAGIDLSNSFGIGDLPNFDMNLSYHLYSSLFGPAEDMLNGVEHLLVVPTGPLESLPLNLLVTKKPEIDPAASVFDNYQAAAWLPKSYSLTRLPSVSSLRALRVFAAAGEAKEPFIGFGDPILNGDAGDLRGLELASVYRGTTADIDQVRNLPELPDTADELKRIAQYLRSPADKIYLRERATETVLKNTDLTNSRVVAFATHGLVGGEISGLAEPALVLSPPDEATEEDDGLLKASEVAQLKMNADIIMLSACNTASGDELGAEGLSGLARAFIYAGARSLLVSHWSVESTSAAELTTGMFDAMSADKSIGRSEALQMSMVDLMTDKERSYYSHPAFWAPFSLVGDGATLN